MREKKKRILVKEHTDIEEKWLIKNNCSAFLYSLIFLF